MKWEYGIQWCLSHGGVYASVHSDLEVTIMQEYTLPFLQQKVICILVGIGTKRTQAGNGLTELVRLPIQTTNPSFTGSHDDANANSSLVGGNTYVITQSYKQSQNHT